MVPLSFIASFFISKPCWLPFTPPLGSRLPGTMAGWLNVVPPSEEATNARPRGAAAGEAEIKNRRNGERETLPIASVVARLGSTP